MFEPWMIVAVFSALIVTSATVRLRKLYAIHNAPLPVGLRIKLERRFPQYSRAQIDEVVTGLRDWFHISYLAKRRVVAMPSRSVDEAWHEFILFTRQYRDYCDKTLGRFLHHVPAEAMHSQREAQEGVRRAWRLACARERIDPHKPKRLPRLFALDARLAFPAGFVYVLDCAAAGQNAAGVPYCASSIGCTSSCGGGSDGSSDGGGDGGGGCGGD